MSCIPGGQNSFCIIPSRFPSFGHLLFPVYITQAPYLPWRPCVSLKSEISGKRQLAICTFLKAQLLGVETML